MSWRIYVRGKAGKQIKRLPKDYAGRIEQAIDGMSANPFAGDIEKMEGRGDVWRRRIGAYRIKFEIFYRERIINIFEVERRTSSTY